MRRRPCGAERAQEDHRLPCDTRCGARQLPKAIRTAADPALKLDHAEGCHAAEADSAPVKVQPQHAVSRGQATAWQPCTVTSHLQPAAGEEIFADSQRDQSPAKTRAREASRRRAREPHKAAGSSVCVVDHLHLKHFVSAQRSMVAPKVFLRRDARAELRGTILRDNADAKRTPVSGSIVWLIEPELMDTSPTSRAFGMMMRGRRSDLGQRVRCLPQVQLASKKRTILAELQQGPRQTF